MKSLPHKKVVVAMSGGVDSSTVAAMLKHEGYEVIGITLQLYDVNQVGVKSGTCCAGIDIYDAKNVAEKLGIPHYVLNYESKFKQAVIDDFADSYLRGETPIPCIRCNQTVKFADLFKMAKDLGADSLATGHYVRKVINNANISELHRALDSKKDQSYFLFSTSQEQLDFLEFPLGAYTKEETRKFAKEYDLEISNKPDSQDICFVPDGNYKKIIEKFRPGALDKGNIVDISGKVVGEHNGIINYTVGQRKGIGIAGNEPYYVIKINAADNSIIVGTEQFLKKNELYIKNTNWLVDANSLYNLEVEVKLRSTQQPCKARICQTENNDVYKIELSEYQKSVTPGQACVAYSGTRVIGGGWIL